LLVDHVAPAESDPLLLLATRSAAGPSSPSSIKAEKGAQVKARAIREEGREEGRSLERLRIARPMLAFVDDDALIARTTGLAEAEVAVLRRGGCARRSP